MTSFPELLAPNETSYDEAHQALMKAFEPVRAYCAWTDAPFGSVFLAKTTNGLCRVTFRQKEDAILADLERRALLPEMAPAKLDRERKELEEYYAGERRDFDVPVDLRWGTPFQRKVLDAARRIPFGECVRYGDLAKRIGSPKAQRAVGTALGKNPVPILIPCHRVVATGGLGGYTGGLDIKRTLLAIEGIDEGPDL